MKRMLALLALAIIGAVAVLWARQGPSSGPGIGADLTPSNASGIDAGDAASRRSSSDTSSATSNDHRSRVSVGEMAGTVVRRLRVVDADTGGGVPGAEVLCFPAAGHHSLDAAQTREFEALMLAGRWDIVLRRFGSSRMTDTAGFVSITPDWNVASAPPSWRACPEIVVVAGERFGMCRSTAFQFPHQIEVARDHAVEVFVVDETRKPISFVPVHLVGRVHERTADTSRLALTRTDANGRARFDRLQQYMAICEDQVLTVVPQVHGHAVEAQLVTFASAPAALEFVIAPTATLSVQLVYSRSACLPDSVHVELASAEPARASWREMAPSVSPDETVLFRIPTSPMEWVATAFDGGRRLLSSRFPIDLNTVAHPTHILHADDVPSVCFGLLDSFGAPLANQAVRVEFRFAQAPSIVRSLVSNRAGKGVCFFEADELAGLTAVELATVSMVDSEAGGQVARVEGLAGFGTGPLDLGEIRLRRLPLLASARLVDSRGEAQGLAHVAFHAPGDPRAKLPLAYRVTGIGRFEVFGELDDTEDFEVSLAHVAGAQREVLRAGDRDRSIVMSGVGSLRVDVRHPGSVPMLADVTLSNASRVVPGGLAKSASGTSITWPRIEPGTYRFEARVVPTPTPAIVVHDVIIRPGQNLDERLVGLSLPEATTLTLLAVARDGSPISVEPDDVALSVRMSPRDPWEHRAARVQGGRIELVLAQSPIDLRLRVPGYLDAEAFAARDSVRVILERAPVVAVQLRDDEGRFAAAEFVARLLGSHDTEDLRPGASLPNMWTDVSTASPSLVSAPALGELRLEIRRKVASGGWDPPSYERVEGFEPIHVMLRADGGAAEVVHIDLPR